MSNWTWMKQLLTILLCILFINGNGQIKKIGSPRIRNYSKSSYNAGTQNWDIDQDNKHFMYFANNQGLLQFDGVRWTLIEIVTGRPIRSILTDSNDNIYLGFFNDFGILEASPNGDPGFKSLKALLPDDVQDFDEIWKIYEIEEGIVFQTYEYLFILKGQEIKVVKPNNRFHFSFKVGGKLYVHEPGVGIYEYLNGSLNEVEWSGELKDRDISAILTASNNKLLICTNGNGVFVYEDNQLSTWNSAINNLLIDNKIYSAKTLIGNYLAFGTILDGLYITDSKGSIVKHINKKNGLQNNTVLSLFSDSEGNVWAGLDNGIDYIEINSPISYIQSDDKFGTGYCAVVFENKLFLGTNTGLFFKSLTDFENNTGEFALVENTAGQVWSIGIYDGELLCCHNTGTYQIENSKGILISEIAGAWKYIRVRNHPELLIGGHFTGLVILKNDGRYWKFHNRVKGCEESIRFLYQDKDEEIWVSHGALGIIRMRINETFDSIVFQEIYTSEAGLPSDERNIVFGYQNEVLSSTIDGLYEFDKQENSFYKSENLDNKFELTERLMSFNQLVNGDVWYVTKNEAGILRLNEDNSYTKINKPLMSLMDKYVVEFESLYPYNNEHVLIGTDEGFAHYAPNYTKSYDQTFSSFITKIEAPHIGSVINFLPGDSDAYKFPYRKNLLRFSYAAPYYENQDRILYSFMLENYSEAWSEWSNITYKEFTNLREGDYIFRVKARNIYNTESKESSFEFNIIPPWQRSKAAIYTYVLLGILFVFFIIWFLIRRIEISKKKERLKHEAVIKRQAEDFEHQKVISEKEIIHLKNEKLSAEKGHLDKELANQTMNIIQKNKLLKKLKEELDLIQNSTNDPDLKTKLLVLSRILNKEIDNKKQNQIFETYFEAVHEKFFAQLKENHPSLTPRDFYLCAYIRMNLTSKEIASLLNITSRGVEISRYRLRKKLQLAREENLSAYLSNL